MEDGTFSRTQCVGDCSVSSSSGIFQMTVPRTDLSDDYKNEINYFIASEAYASCAGTPRIILPTFVTKKAYFFLISSVNFNSY